jgi:hypothetical protein
MKALPATLRPFLWLFLLVTSFTVEPGYAAAPPADPPPTLRFDFFHTGSATEERFSFDRLVVEPLPWPGHPSGAIDTLGAGKYFFEIQDAASGEALFSQGFASIYGEWETTGEAHKRHRTFHESLRFPAPQPGRLLRLVLSKRDAANAFQPVWEFDIDPEDMLVLTAQPTRQEVLTIQESGPPTSKLDLLVMGDGYTAEQSGKCEDDVRRHTGWLFAVEPFKSRRDDFNVWAICPPTAESGISRPSTGVHRRSLIGTTYDAFRSERYVLTFENRTWREVAAWAPYELVLILVNSETYGGGGIYGLYSTSAADNDWAAYVTVHELGHHIAGLADEYYTSDVAYEIDEKRVEPWEANATALLDGAELKWGDLVQDRTALPTAWPKEEFEEHARGIQERRRQIRAANRPEAEMSALFKEQQAVETKLLSQAPTADVVGAFEGANYAARGYYRPQIDCTMFTRNPVPFCAVCRRTLDRVIDRYAPRADRYAP